MAATEVKLQKAAMRFARAWTKWHDHGDPMPDDDLIEASNGILEVLGLEMVDGRNGKQILRRLSPTPKQVKAKGTKGKGK